jgi:hypothetical protein
MIFDMYYWPISNKDCFRIPFTLVFLVFVHGDRERIFCHLCPIQVSLEHKCLWHGSLGVQMITQFLGPTVFVRLPHFILKTRLAHGIRKRHSKSS